LLLSLSILIVLLFSQTVYSAERSLIFNDGSIEVLESSINQNDSLNEIKIKVKVISDLAIGWGLIYNCTVISILERKMAKK
jgi:hypothetical protein